MFKLLTTNPMFTKCYVIEGINVKIKKIKYVYRHFKSLKNELRVENNGGVFI